MSTRQDVIVVGGGQAGPAIGYFLAARGGWSKILVAPSPRTPRE